MMLTLKVATDKKFACASVVLILLLLSKSLSFGVLYM